MTGKLLYSDIQLKARLIRALIGNGKRQAALEAACILEDQLHEFNAMKEQRLMRESAPVSSDCDALTLANLIIEDSELAFPVLMEGKIKDLVILLSRTTPATESEARDGGDCVCGRCQQDEANGTDGLCQACRDAKQEAERM